MIYLTDQEQTRLQAFMMEHLDFEFPDDWAPRALFETYEDVLPTYKEALKIVAAATKRAP